MDAIGLVKKIGIEDHRPVGPIGNPDRFGAALGQEIIGRAFIGIELGEIRTWLFEGTA